VKRRALVVGAGIGGLAAGRALDRSGFDVKILERSEQLDPIGAGISLWPNATSALRELEVFPALAGAVPSTNASLRRWDGSLLSVMSSDLIEQRYGEPIVLLHRATLQQALLADGIEECVRTGSEVVRVKEEGDIVLAETGDGESFEGDVLIGADGVESAVRGGLLGDGPPRPSGLLAYRGVVPTGDGWRTGEYWGAGSVFGLVPIDGNRTYWYATRRTPGGEPPEENPIPALLERYRDWAPEIAEAVRATPPQAVLRHDLYDRKPVSRWVKGRVALLGDAAHPMLPFLGQGACQALEDAQVLGQVMMVDSSITDALDSYQDRRRKQVARVVKLSKRLAGLTHLRLTPLRAARDGMMALTPQRVRLRQLDSIIQAAA
jgi:2-polyprenyl-6-methoxyphenol hydroxylase-like FAD-dependent oxidoreductase